MAPASTGETTLHGAPARFEGGLRRVADGVHAWLQPNGSWGESNAALVTGDGASLLVDTLWTPALTRRMLEAMAPVLADAPLAWLVNSHADGDHCWGNRLLAGREIIATERTAEEMRALVPGTLAAFRRLGRAARLAGRLPLPYPGRATARAAGAYFTGMLAPFDFSDVELTYPTRTFSGSFALDVGGRKVELIEVGPAHTAGDLIAWLPETRTVLAADILFSGVTPVMWAGPVERWLRALDRIEALEPAAIVPGHGPVSGLDELRALREHWTFVNEAARGLLDRGRSPAEAAREILQMGQVAAARWSGWDNAERVVISVHTIHRHLTGRDGAVGPRERIAIFAQAARLAGELHRGEV